MHIKAVYQSNYNGCSIFVADADGYEIDAPKDVTDKCEAIAESVSDRFYEDCNDEEGGVFEGDIKEVFGYIIEQVKATFGNDATATCVEDDLST